MKKYLHRFFIVFSVFLLFNFPAYGKNTVGITLGKLNNNSTYMVWYPSKSNMQNNIIRIHGHKIPGIMDAAWLAGHHPLVLISPGSGSNYLTHWRIAYFLASRGYIVASINHWHDNSFNYSGSSSVAVFNERPKEMSLLLDHFLQTGLHRYVDKEKISVIGFSAGGYTSLVMAGAIPSTKALNAYCHKKSELKPMCYHAYGFFAKIKSIFSRREYLKPSFDPRIKSIIAVATPGDSIFSKKSFMAINIPVLLIQGGEDNIITYPNNATYIKNIMKDKAQFLIIKKASHLSFLSYKPPSLFPLLRSDKNIASLKLNAELNKIIIKFLSKDNHLRVRLHNLG